MDEVNEYAEEKAEVFYDWIEFRAVTLAKKLMKKIVLDKFITLEKYVLNQVETVIIAEAMQCKHYLIDLMHIKS